MKTYIKKWASYLGMSLDSLAEESGISSKIIQKWYDESTTPSVTQLNIISKIMDISMDKLVNIDPDDVPDLNNFEDDDETVDPGKSFITNLPLKEWMDILQINPEDIFKVSGIPVDVIISWMDQKSNPTLLQTKALADMFGLSVDDLINKTPETFYDDYLQIHVFETTKFKTAVRIQNYFRSNGIKNECVVIKSEKYELFLIKYEKLIPLTMFDFFKISINPFFKDRREKEKLDDDKYSGMQIVKPFK